MKAAPTLSGLPISVAPMPPGLNVSQAELARAGDFDGVRSMLADIDAGDAPSLPFGQRMGGEVQYDSYAARAWLDDLVKLRAAEPERRARQAERERQRREDAHAARVQAEAIQTALAAEQHRFFREQEAEHARIAAGGIPRDNGIVTPLPPGEQCSNHWNTNHVALNHLCDGAQEVPEARRRA